MTCKKHISGKQNPHARGFPASENSSHEHVWDVRVLGTGKSIHAPGRPAPQKNPHPPWAGRPHEKNPRTPLAGRPCEKNHTRLLASRPTGQPLEPPGGQVILL